MSKKRRKKTASAARTSSWLRTLILLSVAALLAWCAMIAYRQYAAAQEAGAGAHDATPAGDLLTVDTNPALDAVAVDYEYFNVSFNPALHIPNWVSWELTRDETSGDVPRGKFQTDANVAGCPDTRDYTGSGYDRGHMAPAADMKWNADAMARCFYMTNMCPQVHALNGGTWQKLEEKCRIWAKADSAIVIICGPVLTEEPDEYIGANGVAVPKAFFKVIYSPYAVPPRGIGFIMSNGKVKGGLQAAAVSIDEVEELTGHDFLSALPDSLENAVESQCQFHLWSNLKPAK